MLGGGSQRAEAPPDRTAARTPAPSRHAKNPYDDIFGKMFETGAKQRDEYQKGVESIFCFALEDDRGKRARGPFQGPLSIGLHTLSWSDPILRFTRRVVWLSPAIRIVTT